MPSELPEPRHDPDEVRRPADEILSRPEYQWDDESSNPLDALAEWIAERLSGVAGSFGGGGSLPVWVGWLVLVALVVLAGVIVYRVRHRLRRDPRVGAAESAVVVAEGEDGVDWAAAAEGHEAAGRWREGLRSRYRALVGELAERGVLAELVGRTAGELAREVATTCPPASPAFTAATDLFERAWYGGEATGPDERDRFAGLAADVLAAAAPSRVTGPRGDRHRPLALPS